MIRHQFTTHSSFPARKRQNPGFNHHFGDFGTFSVDASFSHTLVRSVFLWGIIKNHPVLKFFAPKREKASPFGPASSREQMKTNLL